MRLGKFINKTAAGEIAKVKRAQILKGEAGIKRKKPSITFDESKKLYLEWARANRKERSVVFLEETLQRLSETFSGKRLDQITRFSVEGYKSQRAKKAPVRANREIAVLKSMFNRCIEWKKFDGPNPVVGVKLLHEPKRRLRFLDHDEEATLLAKCGEPLRTLVLVGIHTGLRVRAEALSLTWANVDLSRRGVTVLDAYAKNGESRTVPLNDDVHKALVEHRERSESTAPDDPVFMWGGKEIKSIKSSFTTARTNAGLGKDVTPHTLRHTFASRLGMAGVDPRTIQELGGWKRIEMVMRYSHLSDEHKASAVDKLMTAPTPKPASRLKQVK